MPGAAVFDAGAATDAAVVEPSADEPRFRGALAVADRLLGGDLTRAEERCSGRPISEREACVDALLQQRNQDVGAKADRRLSSLEALQRASEAACVHATKSNHEACMLSAMERRLRRLSETCADASPDLTQECIDQGLLEKNAH